MPHSDSFIWPTGADLYAKPLSLTDEPWDADIVSGVENGSLGEYVFGGLDDNTDYIVFEAVAGAGNEANDDQKLGALPKPGGGGDTQAIIDGVVAGLTSIKIVRLGPGFDPKSNAFELIQGDDYLFTDDDLTNGHTDFDIGFDGDPTDWKVEVGACGPDLSSFQGIGSLVPTGVGDEHHLRVEWSNTELDGKPQAYTWQAKLIAPSNAARVTPLEGPLILKANTVK